MQMLQLGQGLVARAFENIHAQVERRPGGKRRALLGRGFAQRGLQPRLEPLRKVAADVRRRA